MADPTSTAETNPSDLPTGEPIPAPPTTSSSSKPPTKRTPSPTLLSQLLALPTTTDSAIAHFQRCLTTPSGIDTTLLFLCYTSRLTGALLQALSQHLQQRPTLALAILSTATTPSSNPAVLITTKTTTTSPLRAATAALAALLATRLKNLGALASETRTIARLWALLGMYTWAKRLVLATAKAKRPDAAALAVSWAQLLSCTAFQVLENGAYLSGRGVLGWSPRQQGRAYVVGSRWLAVYTGLEIGKLLAEMMAPSKTDGEKNESTDKDKEAEEEAARRRSLIINLAWTPLTLHWATEGGFLTDLAVGLGGCIPGVIQMRKLWRETALP